MIARSTSVLFLIVLSFQIAATEHINAVEPFHNVGGFIAGTIIHTAEGPDTIQNIRVNDRVLSLDVTTGKLVEKRVLRVGQTQLDDLAKIVVEGEAFYVNPDHRFYTANESEWVRVRDLVAGSHSLLNRDGKLLPIEKIELNLGRETIYDFKVEDSENYFIGKNQILVHNFAFVIPIFTWVVGEGIVWLAGAAFWTAASVGIMMAGNAVVKEIQSRNDRNSQPTRNDPAPPPRTRNDPLPRHPRTDEPLPDPDAKGVPHTQIGTEQGRHGPYPQAREFGANGKPVRDIDFTDHWRPQNHPFPHQHRYLENPTGGTMMREKIGRPVEQPVWPRNWQ